MYWVIFSAILVLSLLLGWLRASGTWFDLLWFGGFFGLCAAVRYVGFRITVKPLIDAADRALQEYLRCSTRTQKVREDQETKSQVIRHIAKGASLLSQALGHPWVGLGAEVVGEFLGDELLSTNAQDDKALSLARQRYNNLCLKIEEARSKMTACLWATFATVVALYLLNRFHIIGP